jgi:hypothetical protein
MRKTFWYSRRRCQWYFVLCAALVTTRPHYALFVLTSIKKSEVEVKKAERLAPALTEGRPFESLRRGIDIPATAVVAENVSSARFSSRLNTVMTAA